MAEFKNDPKNKRYYWLKLKNDFFDQKEIKMLRRIAGGDTYTIIYLKMLLKSLKDDGKLFYEAIGDNFSEELALDIDEDIENVQVTLNYLEKKGLLEIIEEDEYFLNRVPEMIGSEAYSTERSRRHRARKKAQALQSNAQTLQCNSDETEVQHDATKRKELESEIELDQHQHLELDDVDLSEVIKVYESVFGLANPLTIESLEYWCKDLNAELVIEAIKRASENNANSFKYVETILKNWEKKQITTVEQARALDISFKQAQKQNNRLEYSTQGEYDGLF